MHYQPNFALTAVLTQVISSRKATAADQPNIMVFLVDDMGVMDTSVPFLTDSTGRPIRYPLNEWYGTPSMERIAAGDTFNQRQWCRSPTHFDHDGAERSEASFPMD